MDKSIQIAQKIQEQFRTRVKRKDRGVRQAPYFVTSRTLMPSVLVELGFLTNNSEEDFLHTNDGQTYMASAIYRAIKEYKIQQQQNKVISILDGIDNDKVVKKDEKIQAEILKMKVVILNQLFISSNFYSSSKEQNLTAIEGNTISFFQEGNLYKFTIGNETTIEAAKKLQTLAKNNGYNDAFIIAFYKGKKISLQQAKELTQIK